MKQLILYLLVFGMQILIDQLRRQFVGQDTTALVLLLPKLLGDFSNELKTDATIDGATAVQYLKLVQSLKRDKPTQVVLQPPYSFNQTGYAHDPDIVSVTGRNPYPEDALGANWNLIDPLITQLFGGQVQHPLLMPKDYCKLVPGAVTQ